MFYSIEYSNLSQENMSNLSCTEMNLFIAFMFSSTSPTFKLAPKLIEKTKSHPFLLSTKKTKIDFCKSCVRQFS